MTSPPPAMDDLLPENKHFPIQPQCDVCGEDLVSDDECVGLVSQFDDPTIVLQPAAQFLFPSFFHGTALSPPSLEICRDPKCGTRQTPHRETATSHVECYNFLARRCEVDKTMHLSDVSIAWRQPWKAGDALRLRAPSAARWGMKLVGELFAMPLLSDLPVEIAELIRDYCEDHLIWRLARIAELVDSLKVADEFPIETVQLREVDAWERGKEPTVERNVFGPIKKPYIRLTVDFRGLQKIERLAELPTEEEVRSETCAYAFDLDKKGDEGVTLIHFQNGLARMSRLDDLSNIILWDLPWAPLSLVGKPLPEAFRLTSINLHKCTGLTFFMWKDTVYGIHGHTPMNPHADATAKAISQRMEKKDFAHLMWMYVPFGEPEKLVGLGLRARYKPRTDRPLSGICFMLKLEIAGDVSVGVFQSAGVSEYTREINERSCLVSNVPAYNQPISFVSIESDGAAGVPITRPRPSFSQPLTRTWALLSGVVELRVFEDRQTGFCRGVVLLYRSGATRAVGECRLGEHVVRVFERPTHMCLKRRLTRGRCCKEFRIAGVRDPNHEHSRGEPFKCFRMSGRLDMLFDKDHTHVDHRRIPGEADDGD